MLDAFQLDVGMKGTRHNTSSNWASSAASSLTVMADRQAPSTGLLRGLAGQGNESPGIWHGSRLGGSEPRVFVRAMEEDNPLLSKSAQSETPSPPGDAARSA